jgi:two-component system, LytTR family, sensor kinase
MTSLSHLLDARFRRKTVFYHALGWSLFIFYEVLFVTLLVGFRSDVSIWGGYIFPYAVNITLFYFHAHVTLSYSFTGTRKRYIVFALLIIGELALYLLLMNISQLIDNGTDWFKSLTSKNNMMGLLRQLWRGIYFIGFSSAYWFALRTINSEKKILQLEKLQIINRAEKNNLEKNLVELQNAHLQAQINPHLLFNTLNFIYNKVQEVSEEASEAVILLSELMNYSLRELEPDGKVSLEKEVEQICNIVKINQIRFNNKLFLQLESNGNFRDARVIPLILIPLVENVFKHGNLTDKENPGKVTINYDGDYLEMTTFNKKKKREKVYSHGIGMINVTKRLDNVYKGFYTLNMNGDEHDYYVFLRIKLNLN